MTSQGSVEFEAVHRCACCLSHRQEDAEICRHTSAKSPWQVWLRGWRRADKSNIGRWSSAASIHPVFKSPAPSLRRRQGDSQSRRHAQREQQSHKDDFPSRTRCGTAWRDSFSDKKKTTCFRSPENSILSLFSPPVKWIMINVGPWRGCLMHFFV